MVLWLSLSILPAALGPERQYHAKRILETEAQNLHITIQKLKAIPMFHTDLVFAARTGYCGYRLWIALRGLFTLLSVDVQESERLNKALTLFGDRVPGGSLELCSARASLKHFLGLGGYGLSGYRRFKDVKPTAQRLFRECMDGWPMVSEVESNEHRFGPASQRDDIPPLEAAKKLEARLDPESHPRLSAARLWAVSMNSKLGKCRSKQQQTSSRCAEGLPGIAFVPGAKKVSETENIFLITDKVRTTLHLVWFNRCPDTGHYMPHLPFTFVKSHDLLSRLYRTVCNATVDLWEIFLNVREEPCVSASVHFVASCFFLSEVIVNYTKTTFSISLQ